MARTSFLKSVVFAVSLAVAAPACIHYTPLTSAELQQRGTHRYANTTKARATDAASKALSTLGFNVTVEEPEKGVIKTSPQRMGASASGGNGYAYVTEESFSWSIVVESSGDDAVVRATPHGFRNGSEVRDEGIWVGQIIDPKFQDLWREMDDVLGTKTLASAPQG